MAKVEMVMPSMGESIMEGSILAWLKQEGDYIQQDDSVLEVATDKVDTEVPATHSGTLLKILVQEGEVAKVGQPIATIEQPDSAEEESLNGEPEDSEEKTNPTDTPQKTEVSKGSVESRKQDKTSTRFYSPLVKNIAKKESISEEELDKLKGTGKEGRVTKKDILTYIGNRERVTAQPQARSFTSGVTVAEAGPGDEVIEMDRMRKMIASRMLESKAISAHVTSFVEADVTGIVNWRNQIKENYKRREGESFTFTPIFVEAVAQAIKDFPMINISVSSDKIISRKDINIGIAVALSDGNLIVPVIKNADQLSLLGLSKKINELANKARNNQLKADELADGTYTISNIGSFGNILGTPIIMQPQVAILALGAIIKKPSVVETPTGDAIGIRHKMYLSHSYDHRVVDGALGGMFVKRVADLLETFDTDRTL
jgi:2-oxoglutarate dehydrogenase E2 component (dihydrolipoamide succinyltransferase)